MHLSPTFGQFPDSMVKEGLYIVGIGVGNGVTDGAGVVGRAVGRAVGRDVGDVVVGRGVGDCAATDIIRTKK